MLLKLKDWLPKNCFAPKMSMRFTNHASADNSFNSENSLKKIQDLFAITYE